MEISLWAESILAATTLEEKLFAPKVLSDDQLRPPRFWDTPSRPQGMGFQKHSRKAKLPKRHRLGDVQLRASCLHRFAGHELLAVEMMAYALLAFPKAPKHFRKGLANTLKEEQNHVRLYMKEMRRLGICFGDEPLYKHFWAYTPHIQTPEQYVSIMSLTFEMANLDYAPIYRDVFLEHGDLSSAKLMQKILEDEISHVSFGFSWLKRFKSPQLSDWDAWRGNLPANLPAHRSMGPQFFEKHRKEANVSPSWLVDFKRFCELQQPL